MLASDVITVRSREPIWRVAFSPDGRSILTASSGYGRGDARLWNASTGQPVAPPLPHGGSVMGAAFSPDGRRIVSGSDDKTLRLWAVFEGWADALCSKLGRNMSHKEWQDWISPEIEYKKQCPGLPIPPDEPEKAD